MRFFNSSPRGFTLVEITIVVAVIGILVSIAYGSYSEVRKGVRDKQRVSDLQQLQVALRLYKDSDPNGAYPDCASGMVIGEGATKPGGCNDDIDDALASYLPSNFHDPTGSGSDTTYEYFYDSNFDCGGNGKKVVYAKNMEQAASENWSTVCSSGTEPGTNTYIILLQ